MKEFTDNKFLCENQYKNTSNLNIRSQLHARFSTNKYGWMKWVFDQISFFNGCKILELGCGNGGLWLSNSERINNSWDITLTDFSQGMLEDAKRNLSNLHVSVKFELVDVQSIPYEDNSYDIIIANHMLYHVPDRQKAISEIRRVLKNDGFFYTSTLGIKNMDEMSVLIKNFDENITYPSTADVI